VSATATQSPPTRRCPQCDAPLAPEQDWCLECGTALNTRVTRAPGWGLPVAIILAVLAVCGVAAFLIISALDDDADKAAGTTESAQTAKSTPARTTSPPSRTRTSTVPGAVEAQGGRVVPQWPQARKAFTIVVGAPARRSAAEGRARALLAHGRDAGILRSADYDTFNAGPWVVWRGKYPTRAAAARKLADVKRVYPSAYVTFIRRKA
jgi:hypothetical protein